MPEVPYSGEVHRQVVFVTSSDGFGVALGTAGLNDGNDTGRGGNIDVIAEWEKRIGGKHRATRSLAGLANGNLNGIDSTHLPSTYSDYRSFLR